MNGDALKLKRKRHVIAVALALAALTHRSSHCKMYACDTITSTHPQPFTPFSSYDTTAQCVSVQHRRGCLCAGPLLRALCAVRLVPSCTLLMTGWTHFWQCNEQLGWAAGNSTLLTGTAQPLGVVAALGSAGQAYLQWWTNGPTPSSPIKLAQPSVTLGLLLLHLSCYLVQLLQSQAASNFVTRSLFLCFVIHCTLLQHTCPSCLAALDVARQPCRGYNTAAERAAAKAAPGIRVLSRAAFIELLKWGILMGVDDGCEPTPEEVAAGVQQSRR